MQALVLMLALVCALPAAAQPVTYAWRLDCQNGKRFGPFGGPDACRAEHTRIAGICAAPTLDGAVANPLFLQIADVCSESLNGRGCDCVYAAYPAKPRVSIGDLLRAQGTP